MEAQTIISIVTAALTLLGVGIAIGIYRNKISNNTKMIDENKENIKETRNKHSDFVEKVYDKIENVYDKIEKVYDKLDYIKTYTIGLLQPKSPTTLSKKGMKIAKELHATAIIERIYDEIISDVIEDQNNIPLPYDIQKQAMKIIKEKLFNVINEEEKERLKTVAFDDGVDIEDLLPLMGIVFRDAIFSKYNIKLNQHSYLPTP